jgi:hypothetical protein
LALEFPVDVRAIEVRGDDRSRASIAHIRLVPRSVIAGPRRVTHEVARRAVRYPSGVVYFFDDGAFPEPDAFWVRGGRATTVALDIEGRLAEPGGRVSMLFLRNAPVENRVTVQAGEWREELAMKPGEERTVVVPLAAGKPATLVHLAAAAGFRPSEVSPGNLDRRFLGVWIQLRD